MLGNMRVMLTEFRTRHICLQFTPPERSTALCNQTFQRCGCISIQISTRMECSTGCRSIVYFDEGRCTISKAHGSLEVFS